MAASANAARPSVSAGSPIFAASVPSRPSSTKVRTPIACAPTACARSRSMPIRRPVKNEIANGCRVSNIACLRSALRPASEGSRAGRRPQAGPRVSVLCANAPSGAGGERGRLWGADGRARGVRSLDSIDPPSDGALMSWRRETAPLKKTIPSAKGPESLPFFLASPLFSGALIKGFAVRPGTEREATMLWTIAVILLVLWALGIVRFTRRCPHSRAAPPPPTRLSASGPSRSPPSSSPRSISRAMSSFRWHSPHC